MSTKLLAGLLIFKICLGNNILFELASVVSHLLTYTYFNYSFQFEDSCSQSHQNAKFNWILMNNAFNTYNTLILITFRKQFIFRQAL